MKKQNFQKKLAFKTTKISHVSYLNTIRGGAANFTDNPCVISDVNTCTLAPEPIKLTEAIRCTHTIGNGQNPDGTPCTV